MGSEPRAYDPSRCLNAAAAIEEDLSRLTADLTEEEFHAPTPTGGWSIAHCIEHLVLTGHAFIPMWEQAIHENIQPKRDRGGPFPYSWWWRAAIRSMEPPYKLRMKTGRTFVPRARRPKEEVIRGFLAMHRELVRLIGMTPGIDAARIKIKSPFVSWMRYPLGFSFDFALAHERRHMWQAWQVRKQLDARSESSLSVR